MERRKRKVKIHSFIGNKRRVGWLIWKLHLFFHYIYIIKNINKYNNYICRFLDRRFFLLGKKKTKWENIRKTLSIFIYSNKIPKNIYKINNYYNKSNRLFILYNHGLVYSLSSLASPSKISKVYQSLFSLIKFQKISI